MQDKRRYSSAEGAKILEQAVAAEEDSQPGHTWDELEVAAATVGIDSQRLRRAEAQVAFERSRVWVRAVAISAVCAMAVALLLAFQLPSEAGRDGRLLVHNEQKSTPATVSVMLLKDPAACEKFWSGSSTDFCQWRREQLRPGERLSLEIPVEHAQCARVRVGFFSVRRQPRVVDAPLPAALEIERDGRVDQKGLGRSALHQHSSSMEVDEPCSF